jgi:hypothetical protein
VSEVTVIQDQVVVSSVDLVMETGSFALFEVDCSTKYPELGTWSSLPDITLAAGQYTLRGNRDAGLTAITLPERFRGWDLMAYAARYTVRIVLWKVPEGTERKEMWRDDDGDGSTRPGGMADRSPVADGADSHP